MNKSLLATLLTTALFSTMPLSAPVAATSAILRCQSPDGTMVYTDKACAIHDAHAVPMPGELMTRIAHDERTHAQLQSQPLTDAATMLADTAAIPVSRRSASGGCAHSPTQLAMDLRGALALGDVNRVAESYDWVGMSNQQGQATLDRLQHLIGKPVVDSQYFDARITASPFANDEDSVAVASNTTSVGGNAGVLQLVLGGTQARTIDFDVQRYAGCYFVKF